MKKHELFIYSSEQLNKIKYLTTKDGKYRDDNGYFTAKGIAAFATELGEKIEVFKDNTNSNMVTIVFVKDNISRKRKSSYYTKLETDILIRFKDDLNSPIMELKLLHDEAMGWSREKIDDTDFKSYFGINKEQYNKLTYSWRFCTADEEDAELNAQDLI